MAFRTVSEVLDFVRAFHQRAARLFRDSARHTRGVRARLLLDWLARHEAELGRAMERFQKESGSRVLDHWLQQAPEPQRMPLALPPLHDDLSLDEALELALQLDEYLARLYRVIAEGSRDAKVREFFEELLVETRIDEAATARTAAGARDL